MKFMRRKMYSKFSNHSQPHSNPPLVVRQVPSRQGRYRRHNLWVNLPGTACSTIPVTTPPPLHHHDILVWTGVPESGSLYTHLLLASFTCSVSHWSILKTRDCITSDTGTASSSPSLTIVSHISGKLLLTSIILQRNHAWNCAYSDWTVW